MAVQYNPRIVTEGLNLYLDAANLQSYVTGSTWFSLIGTGAARKQGSLSPTWPSWNSAGYFSFTGGVIADNKSRFDLSTPQYSQITMMLWYRPSSLNGTDNVYLCRMDNDDFGAYTNNAGVGVAAGINYFTTSVTSGDLRPSGLTYGRWCHIALRFDGQTLNGYFNGVCFGTAALASATAVGAGTLRIGTRDDAYAAHFYGDIGPIIIYNRVLSQDEIQQNFINFKGRFGI